MKWPRSFCQRRFDDFNVWSRKNEADKLAYMRTNPANCGLACLEARIGPGAAMPSMLERNPKSESIPWIEQRKSCPLPFGKVHASVRGQHDKHGINRMPETQF